MALGCSSPLPLTAHPQHRSPSIGTSPVRASPDADAEQQAGLPVGSLAHGPAEQAQSGLGVEPEDAAVADLALIPDAEHAQVRASELRPGREAGFDLGAGAGIGLGQQGGPAELGEPAVPASADLHAELPSRP